MYVYLCMYVFMYVCMYVCRPLYMYCRPMCVCMYVGLRMYIGLQVSVPVCMYVRMHACIMYALCAYVWLVCITPPRGPLWPCARPTPGYRRRVGGEEQIPPL